MWGGADRNNIGDNLCGIPPDIPPELPPKFSGHFPGTSSLTVDLKSSLEVPRTLPDLL